MKNGIQLTAWQALRAGIASTTKAMLKWLVTNPAGWCILAATAIAGLIGIVNAATTSTEEYREKLDEVKSESAEITTELNSLNSELETTNNRIKELESKGKLSFVEQEEYENLVKENAERQRKIDLLNLEAKKKNNEKNNAFVDTMESDLASKSGYKKQITYTKKEKNMAGNVVESEVTTTVNETVKQHIETALDKRADLENRLKTATSEAKRKKIEEQIQEIDDYFIKKSNQWTKDSKDIQYIPNPTTEDEKAVNEYLDFINDFQDQMAIAMGGDNAKTNAFSRIVDSVQFDETVQGLQNLGKEGKVTAEMLDNEKYSDFIQKLVALGVIDSAENLDAIALAFNNLSTSTQTASDSIEDSRTKMISSINDMSEGFDSLNKISSSIKDSESFDFTLLDDDKFKETFSGLGDVYTDFIKTITDNSDDIDACQGAFNNLVTEWINSTGILDNVTEQNEKLTASMLKQMGIANADELVTRALTTNTEILANAQETLNAIKSSGKEVSIELENATLSELYALIQSANQAGINCDSLYAYMQQKIACNKVTIATNGDREFLAVLCKSLGIATDAVIRFETLKENLQNLQNLQKVAMFDLNKGEGSFYHSNMEQIKSTKSQIATAQQEMQQAVADAYNVSYQTPVNFSGNTKSATSPDSSQKETKETFNWIETALSRIQRTITNLGKTVSATWRSWTDRNKALKDQVSAVTQEINLQEQAYNRYMALANGVGLPEPYRSLVENGAIDISTISNESLAEQIKTYQDYYEKALACKDATADLRDELANLVQTEFNHTAKRYDDELSMHEHQSKMLQSSADILETKGYMVSSDIYDALARQEEEKITALQNKYASLESVLNSSNIPKYSEQWYEMQLEIACVAEELKNSQKNLAEYNNTLREIDWELFDKLQNKISGVTTESDFLIELMSGKKMFNDDGFITEHGQAALGLHAINYNTYMAKADEYATELEQINAELANDPYNQTLLDRRDELLEQQRDMILAAKKEKQSMKDLKSEGYDALLDSMSSIIDKRKEMFSQIKDLHDYEKSIAEQTAEVSKYQKLIDSMQGMADTEEGRAALQKYEVSLKEAKENLEKTEYERYIKDQEQLLDSLYDQTEEWVNSRLDNLDGLVGEVINSTNANASEIKTTLETEAESVGATLSTEMVNLWSTNGEFTSVVSSYGSQQLTTLQEILATMKEYFSDMKKDAEEKAKEEIAASSPAATPQPAPAASPQSSPANTSSGNASWGSWFISKRDTYPKSKLNTETSVVDRLKYRDIDSSKDAREKYYYAMGGSGVYVGSPQQNQWMLTQMKTHGFTEGGTIGKLIRSSGEDGFILAKTGEEILSLEKIRALGESFALIDPVINSMPRLVNSMDMYKFQPEKTPHVDIGDIHFDLPNVHNADEFITELQHSNRFEKIIKEITYGGALGKNRYNKFKY